MALDAASEIRIVPPHMAAARESVCARISWSAAADSMPAARLLQCVVTASKRGFLARHARQQCTAAGGTVVGHLDQLDTANARSAASFELPQVPPLCSMPLLVLAAQWRLTELFAETAMYHTSSAQSVSASVGGSVQVLCLTGLGTPRVLLCAS